MSNNQLRDETQMDSYTIVATRTFEADFSEAQKNQLLEQTGEEDIKDAIEEALLRREREFVEPEEKLFGISINASGPSND